VYFYSYTYNDSTESIESDKLVGHLEPNCISVPLGQPIWIIPQLLEKINECETYIPEERKVTDVTY
jgi:hypothetical protein